MLDMKKISPIIYIWYEGGWLSPPVVTIKRSSEAESQQPEEKTNGEEG